MAEHKRKCSKVSSKSNKKKDTTLLTWVRDATKELNNSNMLLNIDEEHMNHWDVVFHLNMFDTTFNTASFEVEGDNGWIPMCEDVNESLRKLVDGYSLFGEGSTCYKVRNTYYEAYVQNGNLTQKNLSTDMKRSIRKIAGNALHSQIQEWFQKNGRGRTPGVHLKIKFPTDFPLSPPFVRVVCPRFQQWTGHVTIGGSMCTETLTKSGWIPEMTPIALMLHLKQNLIDGNGRVNMNYTCDYTEKEADDAYKRVANDHGWKI